MLELSRVRPTRLQRKRAIRSAVLEKYGLFCFYCGNLLASDVTLDHIIPECHGGKYSVDNLVPACTSCNRDKKDCLLEEYRLVCYTRTVAGSTYVALDRLLTDRERSTYGLLTQIEVAALGIIARRIHELHPSFLFAWELQHMDVVGLLASAEKPAVRL